MRRDRVVEDLREWFMEAIEYLRRGDPIQASEKLYKVAENAIKILAEINQIPEYRRARQEGTWWSKLLDKAAERLKDVYGEELLDAWRTAYELHLKGFHEEQLTAEEIWERIYKIEDLLRIVEYELRSK